MSGVDNLDLDVLRSAPVPQRALAAALVLVAAGQRPSLSAVARIAGVSRQALHQGHPDLVELVADLRRTWTPPVTGPVAEQTTELERLRVDLAAERKKRVAVERELERALHHLQLAEATLYHAGEKARPALLRHSPGSTSQSAKNSDNETSS